MTDEYIRREDAINTVPKERIVEYMDEFGAGYNSCRNDILRSIESIEPADVVPVVRCKDCKYNASTHKCLNPDSFFLVPNDNDFCSYGERKE